MFKERWLIKGLAVRQGGLCRSCIAVSNTTAGHFLVTAQCNASSPQTTTTSRRRSSWCCSTSVWLTASAGDGAASSGSNSSSSSHPRQAHSTRHRHHTPVVQQAVAKRTAKISGPGVPLLLGLKQLPAGADSLLGWQLLLSGSYQTVGTIIQVQPIHVPPADVPAYHLLHVHKDSVLQPYGFRGRESHRIPLVPAIVDKLHPQHRVVLITPPPGLLDLGRRELLLSFLSRELLQYARPLPHPAGAAGQPLMDVRCMPTKQQLLDAGRSDLVGLIGKVGGFTEAALLLGLRAARRPAGYWDSLEVLDAELDAFVAGSWTALPLDDGPSQGSSSSAGRQQQQGFYFYNMATRSIRWKLPPAARALMPAAAQASLAAAAGSTTAASRAPDPDTDSFAPSHEVIDHNQQQAAVDDEELEEGWEDVEAGNMQQHAPGSGLSWQQQQQFAAGLSSRAARRALLALAEERVMPSQSSLKAAGRWDVHNAIVRNGGYREVAQLLDRRLSWPVPNTLDTPTALRQALAELCSERGWAAGVLPSMRHLRDADRDDVIKAILHHGGWYATAQLLQLRCVRSPPGSAAGSTAEGLAEALLEFMATHPPHPSSSSTGGGGDGSAGGTAGSSRTTSVRTILASRRLVVARHQWQQQQQPQSDGLNPAGTEAAAAAALPAKHHQWQQLPTQRQLLAAGRPDLVAGLQRHGHETIRVMLGLPQPKRKRLRKGALTWQSVEAALQSGCHSVPAILKHITQAAQAVPLLPPQRLAGQPQQQEHTTCAGTLQLQQQLPYQQRGSENPPLVSREHLTRQLKVWCDEGRLVKPRMGRYELPAADAV